MTSPSLLGLEKLILIRSLKSSQLISDCTNPKRKTLKIDLHHKCHGSNFNISSVWDVDL